MKEILIRADGDATIGLGHLIRCTALADMLKSDFGIHFFCRMIPEKVAAGIVEQGYRLDVQDDEELFFDAINKESIVVIDGYNFDSLYQQKIKDRGAVLVCIDDLHNREFFADLIINHAPGISYQDYRAQQYTQFALGPEYALLRPAFLKAATQKRQISKIETLLICFGGADISNLTQKALEAAVDIPQLQKIYVVTGAAYRYQSTLVQLVTDKVELYEAVDENKMLQLMQRADAAIVPSSGILFEVLAAGCIAFSGYYVDNQQEVYKNFKAMNAFEDLCDFSDLQNALQQKIVIAAAGGAKIIDGLSGERLLKLFRTLGQEKTKV